MADHIQTFISEFDVNNKVHLAVSLVVAFLTIFILHKLASPSEPVVERPEGPIALDSTKYTAFKLVKKTKISNDVQKFRFALQTPKHVLGLPIGQHISFKATDKDGKMMMRKYTPTSSDWDIGFVEFVIKVYYPTERFPKGGQMTQYLDNLKIGDTLDMKGPSGHVDYRGNGYFKFTEKNKIKVRTLKKIGMIAGGTGITPMLQIINKIMSNPNDKTEVSLIFANQTEDDIFLRKELEDIEKKAKGQFKLWYTLDRPQGKGWKYSKGFINSQMVDDHLPKNDSSTMIFVCGPPPMIKHACEPAFKELGFGDNDWVAF